MCSNYYPLYFYTNIYLISIQINYIVSLLGAHSLGYVNISNSGYGIVNSSNVNPIFMNAWDSTPHILDNSYFAELLTKVT